MTAQTPMAPVPTPEACLPDDIDLRLVVTDMDGTLVDGRGRVPEAFGPLVQRLRQRGVLVCPASGRQLANLRCVLGETIADSPVIADNGTYAVLGSTELFSETIERAQALEVIACVRRLHGRGMDVGAVVSCKQRAYVERGDAAFLDQVGTYYALRELVDDLTFLELDEVMKIAVFDFGSSETGSAPQLRRAVPDLQVVVSGLHCTDLMAAGASKGRALAAMQERLGIAPSQTAVFGDYLNDLELYPHADLSFAMANAHPEIVSAARYVAPANTDHGVIRTLELLLERMA